MAHKTECATLTLEEARRVLGLGRTAAYDAARRKEIPVLRIGRRLLVPKVALERLLKGESREESDGGAV